MSYTPDLIMHACAESLQFPSWVGMLVQDEASCFWLKAQEPRLTYHGMPRTNQRYGM